jgi:hypothetical protein
MTTSKPLPAGAGIDHSRLIPYHHCALFRLHRFAHAVFRPYGNVEEFAIYAPYVMRAPPERSVVNRVRVRALVEEAAGTIPCPPFPLCAWVEMSLKSWDFLLPGLRRATNLRTRVTYSSRNIGTPHVSWNTAVKTTCANPPGAAAAMRRMDRMASPP